jgi:hypothetical protein
MGAGRRRRRSLTGSLPVSERPELIATKQSLVAYSRLTRRGCAEDGMRFSYLLRSPGGKMLRYISAIVLCMVASASVGAAKESNCSNAVEQISSAAKYVGSSNYVFELKRERSVNVILFLEKPMPGSERMRWRLIERPIDSLIYCLRGQGEKFSLLKDMHLSNPSGKYGIPGSGYPRCAGKNENGVLGSLDIRLWANRELGDSLIYDLPNELAQNEYVFLASTDSVGAWILLDSSRENINDTCYYTRGDASSIHEDFKAK